MRRKVTIKQVAKAAGVSAMTVSRVLNNRPDVSPETRKRVQQVIDEMGYAPSTIARSLIKGSSNTIGVVGAGLEDYGPSRTLVGIEWQANELGYSLLLSLMHGPKVSKGEQDRILTSLLAHQVDGIIWAVGEIGDSREWLCEQLGEILTPVVLLTMQPRPGMTLATVDNYAGGRLAVEHLLEQGYRRIGTIAGPQAWWEAKQREAGWRDVLREAGLAASDGGRVVGDWSAASGQAGMYRLLKQFPDIEAVFAGNDQMALGALQAARGAGRRVPDDLAVVGYDDIPEAAYFSPPLTTIRQDVWEVGSQAVRLLQGMLEARREGEAVEPEVVWVQPQLVVRESSIV